MRMMRFCFLAPFIFASGAVSADLDTALTALSKEVLSRVETDEAPKKIAIATMVHGDGTCSDLSERASDKFQGALFRAKSSQTSVIDRRSLSAIFREQNLVEDGTVSPKGAAKIAEIEQVDAIVTGKMTRYGDDLEFVTTMLDARSGTVIGFAEADFRMAGRDEEMMKIRSLVRCGFAMSKSAAAPAINMAHASGLVAAIPRIAPGSGATYQADEISIQINKILDRGDGQFRVTGIVSNTSQEDVIAMWLAPMIMLDTLGNEVHAYGATGIKPCRNQYKRWEIKDASECRNLERDYTIVSPSLPRNFVITFGDSKQPIELDRQVALTGRILVKSKELKTLPINFPALLMPEKGSK